MAKPKAAIKRRGIDIGTEANDLANELGNAIILGHARPSDDEIIDVLVRVQDIVGPAECEDCGDASDSIERFSDAALEEDNLTKAKNALETALGHSNLKGNERIDAVEAFCRTVLRETAIKWVAERAADMGDKALAESIMKLETM